MVAAVLVTAILRYTDGKTVLYVRADMLDSWKPSYVGAARETRYSVRGETDREWSIVTWNADVLPRAAYRAIRARLASHLATLAADAAGVRP